MRYCRRRCSLLTVYDFSVNSGKTNEAAPRSFSEWEPVKFKTEVMRNYMQFLLHTKPGMYQLEYVRSSIHLLPDEPSTHLVVNTGDKSAEAQSQSSTSKQKSSRKQKPRKLSSSNTESDADTESDDNGDDVDNQGDKDEDEGDGDEDADNDEDEDGGEQNIVGQLNRELSTTPELPDGWSMKAEYAETISQMSTQARRRELERMFKGPKLNWDRKNNIARNNALLKELKIQQAVENLFSDKAPSPPIPNVPPTHDPTTMSSARCSPHPDHENLLMPLPPTEVGTSAPRNALPQWMNMVLPLLDGVSGNANWKKLVDTWIHIEIAEGLSDKVNGLVSKFKHLNMPNKQQIETRCKGQASSGSELDPKCTETRLHTGD